MITYLESVHKKASSWVITHVPALPCEFVTVFNRGNGVRGSKIKQNTKEETAESIESLDCTTVPIQTVYLELAVGVFCFSVVFL